MDNETPEIFFDSEREPETPVYNYAEYVEAPVEKKGDASRDLMIPALIFMGMVCSTIVAVVWIVARAVS